ncbi:hypothetical protein [Paenibacillus sp. sgz302251]|uniref:hypothetical protein n=1 Tax=Paenibacillus sp. sgz302251 TaxID=3414493 RepID=UPI003C7B6087
MKIQVKAKIFKAVKDSKKEMLQFHITGDEKHNHDFRPFTGEVTEIFVEGCTHKLTTEFKKTVGDVNKLVIEFEIRGDATMKQTGEYYALVGREVDLTIASAQMSLEEFRKPAKREGKEDEDQQEAEFEDLD